MHPTFGWLNWQHAQLVAWLEKRRRSFAILWQICLQKYQTHWNFNRIWFWILLIKNIIYFWNKTENFKLFRCKLLLIKDAITRQLVLSAAICENNKMY